MIRNNIYGGETRRKYTVSCLNDLANKQEMDDLQLAKMNLMVQAAKIGLWDMEIKANDPESPDNNFMYSNDFRCLLGFSDEREFPNTFESWSDKIHPDDKPGIIAAFANHLADTTGKTPYDVEYRMQKKDGGYAYYRDCGETIRDKNGNAVRVAGALLDITETKKLLLELENESSTLQTMFDSVSDLIFCKDTDLNYTRCNKSLLKYFGVKEEDVIGQDDLSGLKVPFEAAAEYKAMDREVINENKIFTYEEYVPSADGVSRLFETNKVPLLLNGRPIGVMGIARDITERKAMEEAAQDANRAKSSFLAHMSHEMRTPMNSIIGFSELALDGEVPQKTKEYLNLIIDNSKWLLQLINDILDISKIESGNMKMEQIPFDLHEIFIACKTLIAPKAIEKNIDLFFYAEPFVGKMLIGDPMRLRQVLINLLSNAVKFTEKGTVKLAAVIITDENGFDPNDEHCTLRFEIKDTGIGMKSEQIEQIFKPFTQADVGTTRKYGGTGLGLTITKNIIELMGGKLNIESEPGVGTKINYEITFTTTDLEDETLRIENIVSTIKKPLFEGDILVFEDNNMNQRVIVEHLRRVGFNVELAENGQEGVEIVRRRIEKGMNPFDLIFMDIHMPIMDGIEATPKITELGVETPIIAMTANVMIEDVELYKKIGMKDHIGKPFTSQLLWSVLLKYLKPVSFADDKDHESEQDDDNFYNQMRSDFVKGNKNKYREIIAAVEAGDAKLAHRLAHTLKSNAGQIGMADLQKISAEVEAALKNNAAMPEEKLMNLLNEELAKTLDELKPYIIIKNSGEERPEINAADFDAEKARGTLEKLEPLLKCGSPECLKYVGQLRRIPGSGALIEQIEEFNFDVAVDILVNIKKKMEVN